MVAPRTSTQAPRADGDNNCYESPELGDKSWFDRDRRVIFVNGMKNSPSDHQQSARRRNPS